MIRRVSHAFVRVGRGVLHGKPDAQLDCRRVGDHSRFLSGTHLRTRTHQGVRRCRQVGPPASARRSSAAIDSPVNPCQAGTSDQAINLFGQRLGAESDDHQPGQPAGVACTGNRPERLAHNAHDPHLAEPTLLRPPLQCHPPERLLAGAGGTGGGQRSPRSGRRWRNGLQVDRRRRGHAEHLPQSAGGDDLAFQHHLRG